MSAQHRPFLIIPKLIVQPTWGGSYIIASKKLDTTPEYASLRIGQSYELFGGSKLALEISDSNDPAFIPELGNANSHDTITNNPLYYSSSEHVVLQDLVEEQKEVVVGPRIWEEYKKMPLLIKLNQSKGNSFQLHIKPGSQSERWLPKPESWYYFEDGRVTLGLKRGTDLNAYKQTCLEIAKYMQQLSQLVITSQTSFDEAKKLAKNFIETADPWQFVNVVSIKKGELVDLSSGGIHHSWEESDENPLGNIVYEVQHDVMDPQCTIRSFDQGKFKDDGTIREIHIQDYFDNIDTDSVVNDPSHAIVQRNGENLLSTPYYCLDEIIVSEKKEVSIGQSFEHIYVQSGEVTIAGGEGGVVVSQGNSAFLPYSLSSYSITPLIPSTVLRTYISSK